VLAQGPGLNALGEPGDALCAFSISTRCSTREPLRPIRCRARAPTLKAQPTSCTRQVPPVRQRGLWFHTRAIHNLVLSLRKDLLSADDVVAQIADYAFDATSSRSGERCSRWHRGDHRQRYGHRSRTPRAGDGEVWRHGGLVHGDTLSSHFRDASQALASLRHVAVGGEKVNPRAIDRVMKESP